MKQITIMGGKITKHNNEESQIHNQENQVKSVEKDELLSLRYAIH